MCILSVDYVRLVENFGMRDVCSLSLGHDRRKGTSAVAELVKVVRLLSRRRNSIFAVDKDP